MRSEQEILPWVLGTFVVLLGVVFVLAMRAPNREARSTVITVGLAAVLAVWLSPIGQFPLSRVAQLRLKVQVQEYHGRSESEVLARFGTPTGRERGGPFYVAKPWYAPVGAHLRVQLAVHKGELLGAYVDD